MTNPIDRRMSLDKILHFAHSSEIFIHHHSFELADSSMRQKCLQKKWSKQNILHELEGVKKTYQAKELFFSSYYIIVG